MSSATGGGLEFLKFIEDQLIPKIEATYRVDTSRNSRVIIGHSYGGLFGAYAFCTNNQVFGNYLWGCRMLGSIAAIPLIVRRNNLARMYKGLLFCGILSSIWYILINCYVPLQDEAYSVATLTVSELSAIGDPTRILWVLLVLAYPLLFSAFGWGVMMTAEGKRALRTVGGLILAYSIFNLFWPPMHMRGNEPTLTDTLHIVWAIITNIFMWSFMVLGAIALDKRFRIYTIVSIILHLVFGYRTFLEAPNIAKNGPTPMIGIWERVNILIFMLWVIVFALVLLKRNKELNAENQGTQTVKWES